MCSGRGLLGRDASWSAVETVRSARGLGGLWGLRSLDSLWLLLCVRPEALKDFEFKDKYTSIKKYIYLIETQHVCMYACVSESPVQ